MPALAGALEILVAWLVLGASCSAQQYCSVCFCTDEMLI